MIRFQTAGNWIKAEIIVYKAHLRYGKLLRDLVHKAGTDFWHNCENKVKFSSVYRTHSFKAQKSAF